MNNITYDFVKIDYINEVIQIIVKNYEKQKLKLNLLPNINTLINRLEKALYNIFTLKKGLLAFENKKLVAFISGFDIDNLFGNSNGIYVPLYAHGSILENNEKIYQNLYKEIANLWVKNGYLSHVITVYAQEKEVINTWFNLGFGLRCVDAIRKAEEININNKNNIEIIPARNENIDDLVILKRDIINFFKQSPIFMLKDEKDIYNETKEDIVDKHIWIAYSKSSPVGYIQLENKGESFISYHSDVMNITGAYVVESERKNSIGVILLSESQKWLIKNGYKYCSVDYESLNPLANYFWNKYFIPYTNSLTRRIDENILDILK